MFVSTHSNGGTFVSYPESGVALLLVEDNPDDARFVERLITEHQSTISARGSEGSFWIAEITHVDRLDDALDHLQTATPDVILLDLNLPDSRGLETVEAVVEYAADVPLVVLTGQNELEVGAKAIQRGAQDYLTKGTVTGELVCRTLRYAIERMGNRRELVDRNHRLALLNRIVRQDIRNDVSMIVGVGDQLRSRVDPEERALVELVLEAAQHAIDRTDTAAEVMELISISDVDREPCDLDTSLDAGVRRLERERDVTITVDRRDDDGPIVVAASPMLGSVFDHLLANAVDHSDRTTPEVTVTVETTPEVATVQIADDGVGIPDDQKMLLVDPDARFDDRSGMGAGLYLVTTLLEAFGGTLEIADNEPRGTCVTVSLERVQPA